MNVNDGYSLNFFHKNITVEYNVPERFISNRKPDFSNWKFAETFCNLLQQKNTCFNITRIDLEDKTVEIKEQKNTNKCHKFLRTVFKTIRIFLAIFSFGTSLLLERIAVKKAKSQCDKFRRAYGINQKVKILRYKKTFPKKIYGIFPKFLDNADSHLYAIYHLLCSSVKTVERTGISITCMGLELNYFFEKNSAIFATLTKLEIPKNPIINFNEISILLEFLPDLQELHLPNAAYIPKAPENGDILDLTKFKKLKILNLESMKYFSLKNGFKLDGIKGLTINLTNIANINSRS